MLDQSSASSDGSIQRAVLQAWDCSLTGSPVIYLSGPITTGVRQIEVVRRSGGKAEHAAALEANCDDLRAAAIHLRAARTEIIVEPASLTVPGWSQREYVDLWETFIQRFASRIVLMPGWEFSAGCASELARAIETGLPVECLDGRSLDVQSACDTLQASLGELLRAPADPLTDRIQLAIERALARIAASAL